MNSPNNVSASRPGVGRPATLAALAVLSLWSSLPAAELYREPFRPQFHFSPERNWINDPNGLVFFDGEYHLFYQFNPFGDRWGHMSWGHAVSRDLVHWKPLPVALREENHVMIFSGSAVVDWQNTSGFGQGRQPPLVAIYTGHHTDQPRQNQHLAFSNDRGRTWTKYAGNPVLDIGERDFRDPKVFWHEPTRRWVMVVAWPTHRQVRFYASPNLKDWTHLSDFGPAGSTRGIWECPDLFPVPSEGDRIRNLQSAIRNSKWVLIVNVGSGAPAGGSGCQYFVGHFDGRQFVLDNASRPRAEPEFVPEGRLLADFEGGDYDSWRATGDAFGEAPAAGTLPDQQPVSGFRGRGLVNSFRGGDAAQGTLISPEFEIDGDYLSFLIGGGAHPGQTCLNLLVAGRVARTATGDNDERLRWKSWDVRDLRGRRASLEIVDRHRGGWGHVNVDHILLANAPARAATEPALWADFGRDFYAAVSWSDIPPRDGRRLWLGWMSNWEYASEVPTAPWRGAMSLPRALSLRAVHGQWRLLQTPVRELRQLRTGGRQRFQFRNLTSRTVLWPAGADSPALYELAAEFHPSSDAVFRLELLKGADEATVLRVDTPNRQITLDRTHSGRTDFHRGFAGAYSAPLRLIDGQVKLRVFVDACSLEVFVNDGETVLTSLVFAPPASRGLELAVERGALPRARIDGWKLRSTWVPQGD